MPNHYSIDEIQAFMSKYDVRFDFPLYYGTRNKVWLEYRNRKTGRGYRAFALQSEMYSDRTEIDVAMQCFEYAGPNEDLDGPLLGDSGREDDLRVCDLDGERETEESLKDKADDRLALVVWTPPSPSDGLGVLRRLPRELRDEVYKHAFPRNFWQCYHTRNDNLTLLDITHSNPMPVILRLSGSIRNEALDSAFRDRVCNIIIGSKVIAFNFPLVAGMKPGQALDASRARIPPTTELFIGIQQRGFHYSEVYRQRNVTDIAAARINVKRVVGLLNAIGNQWYVHRGVKIPHIRVSLKTNEHTSKLQYHRSDFELLMGPFHKLQLRPQCSRYLFGKPVTIDRLHPYDTTTDRRNETCNRILSSMSNRFRQDKLLTYRQLMIDLKLELVAHYLRADRPPGGYVAAYKRLDAAARQLAPIYRAIPSGIPPLVQAGFILHPAMADSEAEMNRDLDAVTNHLASDPGWRTFTVRRVKSWCRGEAATNPFWREGYRLYWV